MNIKPKLFFGAMALFVSLSSYARTAGFNFNQDVSTPMELWTALASDSTLGNFTADPYAPNDYCNAVSVNASGKDVSLKISTNIYDLWPQYASKPNPNDKNVGVNLYGIKVYIENGAVFAGANAALNLRANSTLYFNGGESFGDLSMTENASTMYFKNGATFNNSSGSTTIGYTASSTVQKIVLNGSSDNKIQLRNLQFVGAAGTTATNILGGAIEFIADANGITTLNTYGERNIDGKGVFSGVLIVDFTDFTWDESWSSKTFTLVSTTEGNMGEAFDQWVKNADTLGLVIGATGAEFTADAKNIYLTITGIIPEPSTYAAIFGALALVCAAYRRRK